MLTQSALHVIEAGVIAPIGWYPLANIQDSIMVQIKARVPRYFYKKNFS
jgi:hypothetical protein